MCRVGIAREGRLLVRVGLNWVSMMKGKVSVAFTLHGRFFEVN